MTRDNSWQHRSSNRQTYASPYARYLKGFELQNQFIKEDGEPDADGNPTELYKFPEQSATFDRYWTVVRFVEPNRANYFVQVSSAAITECTSDLLLPDNDAYTQFLIDGIYPETSQQLIDISDLTATLVVEVTETEAEFIATVKASWTYRSFSVNAVTPFPPIFFQVQTYAYFAIWSDQSDLITASRSIGPNTADRSGLPILQSNGKYLLSRFIVFFPSPPYPVSPVCNIVPPFSTVLIYRIVKPIPTGPVKTVRCTCNCPDFTRIQEADPMLDFSSRQIRRDWDASQAGAPKDEANNKGDRICKHIWAVKLSVGDEIVTPTY